MTPSSLVLPLALATTAVFADLAQDFPKIRESLKALPTVSQVEEIRPTPITGLYEIMVGPNLLYFSEDGKYFLAGDLVEAKTQKNLTVPRRNEARLKAINALGEDQMFIFTSEKATKHTITVFTDIDCGYCRKLHRDVKSYNENGIKVRYLMFPRAGKESSSYEKAVSAWCAKDRNAALTRSKNGEDVENKECPNPIVRHMALGDQIGVTGTPTIITDTGELLPGYLPPGPLARLLDQGGSGDLSGQR